MLGDSQMWHKTLISLGFFLGLVGQSALAFTPDQTPDTKLIEEFQKIAFGSEYDNNNGAPKPDLGLRKWLTNIQYWMDGDHPPLAEDFFQSHVARLQNMTGVDIAPATSYETSNFLVLWVEKDNFHDIAARYFPNQPETKLRLQRANCFFSIRMRQSGEIVQGLIILPPNFPPPRLKHCIVEELTQAMGLVNDNLSVIPSMFNDRFTKNDLSWKDELFIKMLYHPDVPVGTNPNTATELLTPIVRNLRQQTN